MFKTIKTSKANKAVVTSLTNKFNLGAENVIARIAIATSLAKEEKLDLKNLQDSQGKEYSRNVLLGDHEIIYIAMICQLYGIYKTDKNIPKYIKAHLDDGLTTMVKGNFLEKKELEITLFNI